MNNSLLTKTKISWCPGCSNTAILTAFRRYAEGEFAGGRLLRENLVVASGIGCHGKITDYLALNSFTALHGRLIPAMTGIKCANPHLTVVGFAGDGDAYSEGLEHVLHAARRNSDITLFVHNNGVFALTAGQASSASKEGFKSKSTPLGSIETPLDAVPLLLSAGASFVARTYAYDLAGMERIMAAAIAHSGFSFVEIIQPCVTFSDTRTYDKTQTGIFYQDTRPSFESKLIEIGEHQES